MHDELTPGDIQKMKEEIEHRIKVLRPQLLAEVKRTREFGDLSENYEYKAAKQAQRRNDSRMRYLQNMIKTAQVIDDEPAAQAEGVKLYDRVTLYLPEDEETMVIQVVTTVRVEPDRGFISLESPLGKAVLGKKVGDTVTVRVNDSYSYDAVIQKVEAAEDDGSAPLMPF